MGCRSDYVEQSDEERSRQLALKELKELVAVAHSVVGTLADNLYPAVMPMSTLLDALTQFNCKAVEILGTRSDFATKFTVANEWREKHMQADLNRAAALRKEAAEILKRYGK